jgi:hypothetical protein
MRNSIRPSSSRRPRTTPTSYDLPKFAEDYVHRIGRTGRAGRSGIAVSLVHHAEQGALKRIERFVRAPLPVNVIAGFEPRKSAPSGGRGGFGGGRGRPGGGSSGGRRYGSGSGTGTGTGGAGKPGGWGNKSAGAGSRDGGGYRGGSRDGGSGFGSGSRDGYSARRSDGPRAPRRGS